MDSKIKDGHRSIISKEMEMVPKSKGKEKARKELWDSLCAVYENEDGIEAKARLQQIKDKDEHVSDYGADLSRHTKYDLKLSKKTKSRLLKNTYPNENVTIKCNTVNGEEKGKLKSKELERPKKINTAVPEDLLKEKEKNVPSVIVLHRYKKGVFNTQTEPYAEEVGSSGKTTQRPEKNEKKIKVEHKSNSRKHILSDEKSSYNELKKRGNTIKVEGNPSIDYKQLKDKIRKKRDKGVVYKTVSTSLESKLRKKRKKLERQQLLKEVASTINADSDIYDKIKTLPIKIDENQLIFMHPSHIAKALEHFKIKKSINQERVNNDSTCNELNENKSNIINKEEEKTEASLTKLTLDNNMSSKKLRVLSSIKKMRKPIPIVLEEKSDISFIKVSKHKKEPKKRRCKLLSAEKNKSVLEEPDPEEESRGSGKVKTGSDLMSSENYSKAHCSVIRQNVCFGDNSIDISNVQNNQLPTTVSGSIRSKSNVNKISSHLKNGSVNELKVRRINKKEMEKIKKLIKPNDENENQIKPSASEDENKLTFQLLKSNMNSKNPGRLRKNVYSVSDRMGSKENVPAIQNDRLFVTKRMLFYTNKESSSTSKESLNIAIRRDTEISNNGSSNNVLNVVIKQKKNSSTSTKSINSPKLGIENQCSKNCDTKSLEKMFVENYLEKIYKNNDMNKYKNLKEAECQTEENAFSPDSKEGGKNKVSTQSFELSNNTIQDEFRNFLTFHFKNMNINPAVWKTNTVEKNIDEEVLNRKQTSQPGSGKVNIHCKLGDHYPNYLKQNDKLLTTEHKYSNTKLSGNVPNFDSISWPQNNYNSELKPFIRVLDNDESNLQKTKCDNDSGVSKVNVSDEFKNELVGSDENKGITKPYLRIPENLCQKTESENIAEKLKNIGLSDKTSFVKVVSSNNKLDTSFNTKVDSQDILKFKLMRSPRIKKDVLSKPIKVNMIEGPKTVITRRQKSKFFLPKNITNHTTGMKNDNIPNSWCAKKIINFDSKSTKDNCLIGKNNYVSDTFNFKTDHFSDLEKNQFQTNVIDNLKSVKQNFINVLSANDDTQKKEILHNIGGMANRVEVTKKASHGILKNLILSEVGVQTATNDLLSSVPYKNISSLKRVDNPNFDSKNEQSINEADFFQENPDLSKRNDIGKSIHIDCVDILPKEKGSFVHIINKKNDNDMYLNTNSFLLDKNPQVIFSENQNQNQISVLKSFNEEKQIVEKINAVYEFLQYLDKMLKDNSFLKLNPNKRNTNTIGHFNSTLRCLCNNCIEILNKIEVNGINNLKDRKPLEHFISQPVSEAFFFGQAISEVKNERSPNVNSLSNGQYVTLSELQNNSTTISNDLRSNNGQMNRFCVIVTPEEKSRQQTCKDFFKKIESNQSKKDSEDKASFDFKEKSYENFIKQKFSEMAEKTSMNKKVTCTQVSKGEINNNKVTKDNSKRFYKQVHQRDIPSNDYSSKCLSLKPSLKKSYEPESKLNFVGYSHTSKYHPHDRGNPQFNCINNDNYKMKLDSVCSKNVHDGPGHCFSKQNYNSKDSNLDLRNSSKTASSPLKKVSSRSQPSSSNVICQCCLSRNISSGEDIEDLQNGNYNEPTGCQLQAKPTIPRDVGLCRECNNVKTECCSQNTKPSNKKMWLPKIKSSFRMSFKKDDKTAIQNLPQCLGLPSHIDEKIPLGKKNAEETTIQEKPETQPNFNTLTKNQLNVKNKTNSLNFTKISENSNQCTKCKRDSTISCDKQSYEREITDKNSVSGTSKGFGAQTSLSNTHSPRGSIIIIKRNLQKDSSAKDTSTGTSNSVEYLYSSHKCNTENESNQEDKELDSDGWVPLNDVTEIENNQIYLGMDIKNMTVRHVEYVQKFPEKLTHCEEINKSKEN